MIENKCFYPLISVIVPIYNAASYLNKCIDSIRNQTYTKLEIILIDDGSNDSSADICDEFAAKDDRIQVVHKSNEGLVRARKEGLQLSHGGYIAYVDADDWIDSDMYMRMFEDGLQHGVDMAVTGNIRELPNGASFEEKVNVEEGIYLEEDIHKRIWPLISDTSKFFAWGISLTVWRSLYKREIIFNNLLSVDDGIKMGEDIAIVLPCYFTINSIAIISGCFYHYRQHKNSMKRISKKEEYRSSKVLLNYLLKRAEETQMNIMMEKKIVYLIYFQILMASYTLFIDEINGTLEPYHIKRGSKVIIYGAGIIGEEIYTRIQETNFCKIMLWVDSNAEAYGEQVKHPEEIKKVSYDYIILAVTNQDIREQIKRDLIHYGIDSRTIADIDKEFFTLERLKNYLNVDRPI